MYEHVLNMQEYCLLPISERKIQRRSCCPISLANLSLGTPSMHDIGTVKRGLGVGVTP
jgi:hypothetical protein